MDVDDEKTINTTWQQTGFKKFFEKQGEEKSKKLCHYIMDKVILFKTDYNNPERLYLMDMLKAMQKDFKEVFNKEMF